DYCAECVISRLPLGLQNLVRSWVDKEISIVEKKVAIHVTERAYDLLNLQLEALATDIINSRDQSRYMEMLPTWALQNLDTTKLEDQHRELTDLMIKRLYPILDVRYPDVIGSLASNSAITDLINTPWDRELDEPYGDDASRMATVVRNALQAIKNALDVEV